MEIFLLWLFSQSNAIVNFVVIVTLIGALAGTVAFLVVLGILSDKGYEFSETWSLIKKPFKYFLSIWIIFASISIFFPDRTGWAIIIGGYYSLEAVQTEQFDETSQKLYRLMHKELDSALEESEDSCDE